jgi:hypothetical protein
MIQLILTTGKEITIEKSYSDARSLVTFSGVYYCDDRDRVLLYASRTIQIVSCFDALSIT